MSEQGRYRLDKFGNQVLIGTEDSGSGGSSGRDVDADVMSKSRLQSTKGLASKVKADAFVPPRMEPNEDSATYSARVGRAREAWNQSRAMKK